MAVAIRLRREGNRNRAFYRIVVADKRARRDGRFIETLGTYDPNLSGTNFNIDVERTNDWITKGAQPSDTVRSILKKARRELGTAGETETEKPEAPAAAKTQPKPETEPEPAGAKEESKEAEPTSSPAESEG